MEMVEHGRGSSLSKRLPSGEKLTMGVFRTALLAADDVVVVGADGEDDASNGAIVIEEEDEK